MLTDSEILDEKTQSLDEVLEKLEAINAEEEPGPVSNTVRDVMKDNQLEIAVECIDILNTLYQTVSQEGICQYDVQTLRTVQARMSEIAELRIPKVALERYDGMFTEERSMLNQSVSQESIAQELWRVVKEWFVKLANYIADVWTWMKNIRHTVDQVDARLEGMTISINDARRHYMTWVNLSGKLNDRKLNTELSAIQEELLRNTKLPKNKLALMGFGDVAVSDSFNNELTNFLRLNQTTKLTITEMAEALKAGDFTKLVTIPNVGIAGNISAEIKSYTETSSDIDYITNSLPDVDLRQSKRMLRRKIFYIKPFTKEFGELVTAIRAIRKFESVNDPEVVEKISTSIKAITAYIKAIEVIIDTIIECNTTYLKVSATYMNYYIRAMELVREDMAANAMDDIKRAAFDKAAKVTTDFLDRLRY